MVEGGETKDSVSWLDWEDMRFDAVVFDRRRGALFFFFVRLPLFKRVAQDLRTRAWLSAQKHPRRKGRQPQLTFARVCSF